MRNPGGSRETSSTASAWAAASRLGEMSVDFIEADVSMTRITVPVVTGTFTERSGRATPSTSRA